MFKYLDCPENCGISVSYHKLMTAAAMGKVCVVIPVPAGAYIYSATYSRGNSVLQIIHAARSTWKMAEEKGYLDEEA